MRELPLEGLVDLILEEARLRKQKHPRRMSLLKTKKTGSHGDLLITLELMMSDSEWKILKPLLPRPKGFGHPVQVDFREILNGIFYVQRTGCQWEMMPHDLPPYTTVYRYFKKWQHRGFWQLLHDQVRQKLRTQLDRDKHSTVAIADSQSVKTTEKRECLSC